MAPSSAAPDRVAREGNRASLTDGAVGVQLGFAGVRSGVWNALINLADVTDAAYAAAVRAEGARLVADATALLAGTASFTDEHLGA